MKHKINVKRWLKEYWAIIVLFFFMIASIVAKLIEDIVSVWNGEKSLKYLLLLAILLSIISVAFPVHEYCIRRKPEIIKSNNELYRFFEKLDKENKILNLKSEMDDEFKEPYLGEMNKILRTVFSAHINLSTDDVDKFMNDKIFKTKPYNIDLDNLVDLNIAYSKYNEAYSLEFEMYYAEYKSGELIKPARLPIFSSIIPILLTIIGVFVSLYSSIASVENITSSIFVYLALLVEFILYFIISILFDSQRHVNIVLEKNKKIMSLVEE